MYNSENRWFLDWTWASRHDYFALVHVTPFQLIIKLLRFSFSNFKARHCRYSKINVIFIFNFYIFNPDLKMIHSSLDISLSSRLNSSKSPHISSCLSRSAWTSSTKANSGSFSPKWALSSINFCFVSNNKFHSNLFSLIILNNILSLGISYILIECCKTYDIFRNLFHSHQRVIFRC